MVNDRNTKGQCNEEPPLEPKLLDPSVHDVLVLVAKVDKTDLHGKSSGYFYISEG